MRREEESENRRKMEAKIRAQVQEEFKEAQEKVQR